MDVADVISTSGRGGEPLDEAVLDMVDEGVKERQRRYERKSKEELEERRKRRGWMTTAKAAAVSEAKATQTGAFHHQCARRTKRWRWEVRRRRAASTSGGQ